MSDPKVSIIVPTLNEEKYLPILLGSLSEQKGVGLEVLVVDAKSEDQTAKVLDEMVKELSRPDFVIRHLVSPKRNVAHQRNMGAHHAQHPLVLFLDADTEMPRKNLIADVVRRFERRRLGTATVRLKSLEHRRLADLYYAVFYGFTWVMQFVTPFASGAFILTTKESFLKSGGFDESIVINEDANFCKRSRRYGKFGVLSPFIYTSSRRFDKMGYAKSAWMYVRIGAKRLIKGELRDPKEFDYEFGKFDKPKSRRKRVD